jgi:hypothetical protein
MGLSQYHRPNGRYREELPFKYPASYNNQGGNIMPRVFLCIVSFIAATTATAQTPIPRQGNSCPTGTYKSGDYCKPFKSNSDQVIIQKSGSNCPTGFYKSGNYCKRISSSDREALPRESGGKCPTGWYKSGGYCMKQ